MSYSVDAFSKQVFGRLGEIAIVSELPSNPSILWMAVFRRDTARVTTQHGGTGGR
jgi:hypothetical protein